MSVDMKYFVLVFAIAVLAYGNAFYIIGRNSDDNFSGDNQFDAMIYSYRSALGDFDNVEDFNSLYGGAIAYFLWLSSTLLTLLILLNLVIAIMGDTFSQILETAESSAIREIAGIMSENEFLINRKYKFGNKKYIILISQEEANTNDQEWEGNLNFIKEEITKNQTDQQIALKRVKRSLERSMLDKIDTHTERLSSFVDCKLKGLSEKVDRVEVNAMFHKELYDAISKLYENKTYEE